VRLRDIPNLLSLARIASALPIAWLLLHERYGMALSVFIIAGVSDALDGYLAKRFSWHSRLGSILDPLADKVLLVTNYAVLGWMGWIPSWLLAAVIGREVVVVSGALAYYVLIGRYEMAPSMASKVNTVLQLILVVTVVASLSVMDIPSLLVDVLTYAVLVSTVWSGVDYAWTWGAQAYRARFRS